MALCLWLLKRGQCDGVNERSRKRGQPDFLHYKPQHDHYHCTRIARRIPRGLADGRGGTITVHDLMSNTKRDWRKAWHCIALWLLIHEPLRVIDFLLATHTGPVYPPLKCVEDCLEYISRYYDLKEDLLDKHAHVDRLISAYLETGNAVHVFMWYIHLAMYRV